MTTFCSFCSFCILCLYLPHIDGKRFKTILNKKTQFLLRLVRLLYLKQWSVLNTKYSLNRMSNIEPTI